MLQSRPWGGLSVWSVRVAPPAIVQRRCGPRKYTHHWAQISPFCWLFGSPGLWRPGAPLRQSNPGVLQIPHCSCLVSESLLPFQSHPTVHPNCDPATHPGDFPPPPECARLHAKSLLLWGLSRAWKRGLLVWSGCAFLRSLLTGFFCGDSQASTQHLQLEIDTLESSSDPGPYPPCGSQPSRAPSTPFQGKVTEEERVLM